MIPFKTFLRYTDDVLEALPKGQILHVKKQLATSDLHFPIEASPEDTISIIEFYLNKEWRDIPKSIQESSLEFIRKKNGVFTQVDGIAVLERVE